MLRLGICAGISALVMSVAPALAGDANWGGLYIGAHAGHAWGDFDGDVTYDSPNNNDTAADHFPGGTGLKTSADGWFGGAQVGYNIQSGHLVFGVEADVSAGDADGSGSATTQSFGTHGTYTKDITTQIEWLGTVRARLGVTTGPALIYATGGFAWAKTEADQRVTFNGGTGGPPGLHAVGSASETLTGWTAGGGIEWAIARNWSIKSEYLYVDLGDASYNFVGTHTGLAGGGTAGDPHSTDGLDSDVAFHSVRVGLNYKFGGRDEVVPLK